MEIVVVIVLVILSFISGMLGLGVAFVAIPALGLFVDEFDQMLPGNLVKEEALRSESREEAERFAEQQFSKVVNELGFDPARTKTMLRFGAA